MKIRAAVCYEFGKPLVVEEIDIDSVRDNEVFVRTGATAVCHSDIHSIRGELGGSLPRVVGHETAGRVETVGKDVRFMKPGDTVVVSLLASCGHCYFCVTGMPWMCENRRGPLPNDRLCNSRGEGLYKGGGKVAGYAEYVLVDESQVVKIADDFPLDRAALLACGVITGFGAVVNRAKVEPMSSVAVIGTGGVGLNAVQGAAFSGAHPVIGVDISDFKLESSRVFGATHTVRADSESAVKEVKSLTAGRGADYVFVTVGNADAVKQGISMAGPRGMIVVVGLPGRGKTITISPFLRAEKMLTSSSMGSTRLSIEVPKLIDLYRAGRLKLDELITSRYPFEEINEAIESTESGEALRNVIMF